MTFQRRPDGLIVQSVTAETDHNGKPAFMRAERVGEELMIEGLAAARYRAPSGTMIGSHWERAQLDGPMVNPRDGSLLRFAVTAKGSLDLCYDTAGVSTSLQAKVKDGSIVTYLPMAG